MENQIQIIESEQISRSVVRELQLENDAELNRPSSSLATFVRAIFGQVTETHDHQASQLSRVLSGFSDRISARRIGQSYAIEISFWSEAPEKASKVTNSVAAAYVRDQLLARQRTAESGSEVIEKRIQNIKAQVAVASAAVRSGQIEVESFPSAEARVLTAAATPLAKSWPKTSLVLLLSGAFGILAGLIIAAVSSNPAERSRRS